MKLSFRILDWEEKPYELLLMADPSKAIVDEYLSRGVCFIAEYEGEMVGSLYYSRLVRRLRRLLILPYRKNCRDKV